MYGVACSKEGTNMEDLSQSGVRDGQMVLIRGPQVICRFKNRKLLGLRNWFVEQKDFVGKVELSFHSLYLIFSHINRKSVIKYYKIAVQYNVKWSP